MTAIDMIQSITLNNILHSPATTHFTYQQIRSITLIKNSNSFILIHSLETKNKVGILRLLSSRLHMHTTYMFSVMRVTNVVFCLYMCMFERALSNVIRRKIIALISQSLSPPLFTTRAAISVPPSRYSRVGRWFVCLSRTHYFLSTAAGE